MNEKFVDRIQQELQEIETAGLFKKERIITSEQAAEIIVNGKIVLNFCANNYLGLSSHPKVIEAAHKAIETHGYGMSSVRFRFRYEHNNMDDLEAKLKDSQHLRSRIIVTDGSFSMDGTIAQLDKICGLADQYDATVMVDDSHSSGFLGKTGRGTHEYRGVMGRIDIITGTLGKALGGANGGFTSGRKEIVEMLRQRSRPYLFSNTLAPAIVGASIAVFDMLTETTELRDKLEYNTKYFRTKMTEAGFDIKPGDHPIVPIMLYDAVTAQNFAAKLLDEGIYVIGFFYPVVPKGLARVRVQLSAAHEQHHLDKAIEAFTKVGKELKVLESTS